MTLPSYFQWESEYAMDHKVLAEYTDIDLDLIYDELCEWEAEQ